MEHFSGLIWTHWRGSRAEKFVPSRCHCRFSSSTLASLRFPWNREKKRKNEFFISFITFPAPCKDSLFCSASIYSARFIWKFREKQRLLRGGDGVIRQRDGETFGIFFLHIKFIVHNQQVDCTRSYQWDVRFTSWHEGKRIRHLIPLIVETPTQHRAPRSSRSVTSKTIFSVAHLNFIYCT